MLTRRTFLQTSALAARRRRKPGRRSGSRSSRPSTGTSRTPSTWAIASWSAIRTPAPGSAPNMKVVSLYVDQKPEGDLSGDRAQEFGFTVYPTIAETLRCGGTKLAVDAVLIIGEHGDYPRNEKGQILYPRYEFFEQCAKVFEEDGRAVPGLQRQASLLQLREGEGDGGDLAAAAVSAAGRLVAAGDVAAAVDRTAARLRDRRGADGRRRRLGRDGFPRARRLCSAWSSAAAAARPA